MIRLLLPILYSAAQRFNFDIALVTNEKAMYSALQAERRLSWSSTAWRELPAHLLDTARQLSEFARRRELVLFIGAGTSYSCGLPSWYGLLRILAERAPLALSGEQMAQLMGESDPLEQGQALLAHYGTQEALKREIARLCTGGAFSLQHALLASLSSAEVVTTNYDAFFEKATRATGRSVAVIPYEAPKDVDRWLVKMHGCVDRPQDIVITKEDYELYQDRRACLQGIVQSLLVTKHMLFLGFSLTDPNFHSVMDSVRRATRSYRSQQVSLGTSVQLQPNAELAQLFQEDLAFAWMSDEARPISISCAARMADIFLDCLNSHAQSAVDFIANPIYDSMLSEDERLIKKQIQQMMLAIPVHVRGSHTFKVLAESISHSFGNWEQLMYK